MHAVVTAVGVINSVIFVALAALTIVGWRRRRDRASGWLALTFLTLGLIVTVGRLVPSHPHAFLAQAAQRLDIEMLVLFPYLLYRFANVFAPPSARIRRIVAGLTIVLSVWTFALPRFPSAGESRPWWFVAYIIAFLIHWTLLSIVVARQLWSAGQGQPSVSSSRMRLLAFASAALTVAIIGVAFVSSSNDGANAAVQLLGTLAGLGFLLGLSPPQFVRSYWRLPEQARLQDAIRGLMTLASTRNEVAERVLPSMAAIVGARGGAILDGNGHTLAEQGDRDDTVDPVRVDASGATVLLWTSPYAPFFGDDELRLMSTLAALVGIALDRVRLFEQEHEARLGLERANEVMTNFVALAAHELRTPVTTIHGFVQTLNHLGERLSEEQTHELREGLEQQTARMALLVEQLLDLSRLDADAIKVTAQRIDVRSRVEEVVSAAASGRGEKVEVEVPESLQANLDPAVLDHILTNLVTNAFRYGAPPIRVSAAQSAGGLRILVEDAGPGVAAGLEATLFERFTRAGVARDRVPGTGLGLAIARAYARAHSGDLHYEPGRPSGARFVVELPSI